MGEQDQHLYELVWGEPVPAAAGTQSQPPPPEPEPLPAQTPPQEPLSRPVEDAAQVEVRARLTAIEESLSDLSQVVQGTSSTAMSQEMILISLEALESRMTRLEKGLVRSLEHLESIIVGSRLR